MFLVHDDDGDDSVAQGIKKNILEYGMRIKLIYLRILMHYATVRKPAVLFMYGWELGECQVLTWVNTRLLNTLENVYMRNQMPGQCTLEE